MIKKDINNKVINEFKILKENPNLTYLNSASTSIMPSVVLAKLNNVYSNTITSLKKSFNYKDQDNEKEIDKTYEKLALFLNADKENIVPSYGVTDAINKIAFYLISKMNDGDEIILGELEHASNILPWVHIAKELNKKIIFKWYKLDDWSVDLKHLKTLITNKTKIISIAHIYNTTGQVNDIKKVREVIGKNVILLVDAAQSIGHIKIDVKEMDCDYLVFSAHKAFGPLSLGFIYIKDIKGAKPFNFGGGMNHNYSKDNYIAKEGRLMFQAGTQDVPGIISFGTAIDFINSYGIDEIRIHNYELKDYAEKLISGIPNIKIINKGIKSSILFFEVTNSAAEDVAYHIFQDDIIVRAGTCCVKIKNGIYEQYKSVRASFHLYNTKEDVDKLYASLKKGGDFLGALFAKREDTNICE